MIDLFICISCFCFDFFFLKGSYVYFYVHRFFFLYVCEFFLEEVNYILYFGILIWNFLKIKIGLRSLSSVKLEYYINTHEFVVTIIEVLAMASNTPCYIITIYLFIWIFSRFHIFIFWNVQHKFGNLGKLQNLRFSQEICFNELWAFFLLARGFPAFIYRVGRRKKFDI